MSGQPRGYALKFISGKYQGGEYPLKVDREVVIGRSSELDMVLVEDMVSRKHAVISYQQGAFQIQDLGSTNGTFVNGEKVKKTRLKEGDRILIGTSILKLIVQEKPLGDTSDAAIKASLENAARQAASQSQKATSMQGRLEEVPLPDLLQLFTTSKKNGVLTVEGENGTAKVYLRTGKITYCVLDDNHALGPEQSFYRLLSWDRGAFKLGASSNETFKTELDQSTEALLMEGLRRLDERRRVERDLPPLQSSVQLSSPLSAPLRKLGPAELDVLQAVLNYGNLGMVLERSPGSDLETANIIKRLLKEDYIRTA